MPKPTIVAVNDRLSPFAATPHWPPADVDRLVMSFPKAGRTWLRVLVAAALGASAGGRAAAESEVGRWLASDRVDAAGHRLFFTHGLSQRLDADGDQLAAFAERWASRPTLVVVRDPRDVVVSYYFQRTRRPFRSDSHSPQDLSAFLRDELVGAQRIVTLMNAWQAATRRHTESARLSYESLHRDTVDALRRSLRFLLGVEAPDAVLQLAARFGSFDHMRELEVSGRYPQGKRLWTARPDDPTSYKTRSGRIGGFAEHLGPEDSAWLDRLIDERLDPALDYRRPGAAPADRWP